jgi:vacuolar protein sorting-associated protein 33A
MSQLDRIIIAATSSNLLEDFISQRLSLIHFFVLFLLYWNKRQQESGFWYDFIKLVLYGKIKSLRWAVEYWEFLKCKKRMSVATPAITTPTEPAVSAAQTMNKILPLNELQEASRKELLAIIDSLRGLKCLVVQSELGGLLNQIIVEGSKSLKDIGVQYFRELRGELGDFTQLSKSDDAQGRVGGESGGIPDNIIYLVRPDLEMMKTIASQINASTKQNVRSQYHVYFVPYRTVACEQILEDEGVLDICEIGEFNLGMVPFDSDLLSLEMPDVFRQCYIDGDTSSLQIVASALHGIQELYGIIPNVKSKGAASRKVLQNLLHLRRERERSDDDRDKSNGDEWEQQDRMSIFSNRMGSNGNGGYISSRRDIDTLVVLDREIDLVSPLISPLTYEGLIDDIIGIDNGKIRLAAELLGDEPNVPNVQELTGGKVQSSDVGLVAEQDKDNQIGDGSRTQGDSVAVPLNNGDTIFAEIRDLSIERLGGYLQDRAIKIKQRYAAFRDNKDASISEIHDFVKKLPALTKEYKSLYQHINIAELIKKTTDSPIFREQWQGERGMLEGELFVDQIDDIICADVERQHLYRVLRLLCIQSITAGGIRSNRYDGLRRLVVQTYGYETLFLVSSLEKVGLLKRKDLMLVDTAPVWQGIRKQLKLVQEEGQTDRSGISYVTAGYAPLTARLVEHLGNLGSGSGGWKHLSDVMRLLPGPMLEFTQSSRPEELNDALKRSQSEDGVQKGVPEEEEGKKVLLLFMVGGLSMVEVAALRHLSKDPKYPYHIIMATTKLTNGSQLLKSVSSSLER